MKVRSVFMGTALALCAGAIISTSMVQAKPEAVGLAKKAGGKKISCATCHVSASNLKLNPYGAQLKKVRVRGKVTAASLKKVEKLDADKDGKKNGAELKAGTNPGKK